MNEKKNFGSKKFEKIINRERWRGGGRGWNKERGWGGKGSAKKNQKINKLGDVY